MKKAIVLASAAALCTASAALAGNWDPDLDTPIVINGGEGFTISSGQTVEFSVELAANPNPVVGFSFAGVISGISGNATWASDTALTIIAPDGTTVSRGGFPAPADPALWWDFQGSQSTDDGLYVHGLGAGHDGDGNPDLAFGAGVDKGGVWTFQFRQDFGTVTWEGVTILLHKVPAPGALALLGLAGLVGARRRRH